MQAAAAAEASDLKEEMKADGFVKTEVTPDRKNEATPDRKSGVTPDRETEMNDDR